MFCYCCAPPDFASLSSLTHVVEDERPYPGPAESHIWMDAHAHPGRCFLTGLPASDLFVQLMGAPDVDTAVSDLVAGGVGIVAFSTVGDLRVLTATEDGIRAGREFDPGEAAEDHRRQLHALTKITEGEGRRIVLKACDLRPNNGVDNAGLGIVVSCEGADFLEGRLEGIEEAYEAGARSITLVHYRVNELGDIQTEDPVHDGLTAFGAEVVREMNRLGMVIDLAHATWDVTRNVLDLSTAPVVISHSHLATETNSHPRLLGRDHAQAVTRAGGVVAAWPSGVALGSFDDYIDEILRMIDLLGLDHVAIGTDMDANYRPVLKNYREFPRMADALRRRGLATDELGKILGGNILRVYEQVLA
jgi:membrane dipeptidase